MGNEDEHKIPTYCRKEADIARLEEKVSTLSKLVMGNGQEGLATSVPRLTENVEELTMTTTSLRRGISGFMKFQAEMEGSHAGREEIRKRNRWIIGTLITVVGIMMSVLIFMISKVLNHLPVG